jgi:hypothetical protein
LNFFAGIKLMVAWDVVNGLKMVRNVIKEPMLKILLFPIDDVTGQTRMSATGWMGISFKNLSL